MKKLFKLSPAMKEELERKGRLALLIEAIAFATVVTVLIGALYVAHAISQANLSGGF